MISDFDGLSRNVRKFDFPFLCLNFLDDNVLQNNSKNVNHLHIKYLIPLQKGIKEILSNSKDTLIIEANYSGQLSKLISMETGFQINHTLFKYDGEPFYPEQIIDKVEDLI